VSPHETRNDNGVRVVNFATLENLIVNRSMLPHLNIHKYIWTSPHWNTHNETEHVLIDKGNSNVVDVLSFSWCLQNIDRHRQ